MVSPSGVSLNFGHSLVTVLLTRNPGSSLFIYLCNFFRPQINYPKPAIYQYTNKFSFFECHRPLIDIMTRQLLINMLISIEENKNCLILVMVVTFLDHLREPRSVWWYILRPDLRTLYGIPIMTNVRQEIPVLPCSFWGGSINRFCPPVASF